MRVSETRTRVACYLPLPRLGIAGEHDVEPHPPVFYEYVGLYRGTRALEEVVHRPTALVLHILEDVGVAPEGHGRVGVAEHLRDGVQWHPLA